MEYQRLGRDERRGAPRTGLVQWILRVQLFLHRARSYVVV